MMISPLQLKDFGGTLSLGAFLATLNIFKELGKESAEIYMEIMEIQRSIGPLRKVSTLMNLETDLVMRMMVNRSRRKEGETQRLVARRNSMTQGSGSGDLARQGSALLTTDKGEQVFAVDTIPISLANLSFRYGDAANIWKGIDMKFDQGKLYAFVGPPHEGKATLLKLLGQVLLPEVGANQGSLFVPPHLRILHLSQDTLFLNGTLLKNLIFNSDHSKVGGLPRVKKICQLLHFPATMMTALEDQRKEFEDQSEEDRVFRSWMSLLSHSDYSRINMARALIVNPECLVLHKPALAFDDSEAMNVISLIRKHVDERGLELPVEGRKFRRRRTVFFSSSTKGGLAASDCVFHISSQGIKQESKAEAIDEMEHRRNIVGTLFEKPSLESS